MAQADGAHRPSAGGLPGRGICGGAHRAKPLRCAGVKPRPHAGASQNRISLCAIANRSYFLEHLRLLADARGGDAQIALVLLDVDAFKDINDTFGHVAGDKVIQAIANGLSEICPEGLPARLGGDEFALVCRAPSLHELNAKAEEIREAATWQAGGLRSQSHCRAYVCGRQDSRFARARYRADPAPRRPRPVRREKARRELPCCFRTLARGGISGKIDARRGTSQRRHERTTGGPLPADRKTRRQHDRRDRGAGALASSNARDRSVPIFSYPFAEDIGLISELGLCARRACRDLTKLQPGLRVCVNVSPLQPPRL